MWTRRHMWAGLAAAALLAVSVPALCARQPATRAPQAVAIEVLVFEVENCPYCRLFRRDVLPEYVRSKRAEVAPIRFIDARKADPTALGLEAPLTVVPTVVVLEGGRERGRITGYMGPEPFFHMIARIVRGAGHSW